MMDLVSDTLAASVTIGIPQGRLGRPQEIAATVAFVASDEASFMVGETVSVNGGMATI